MKNPKGFSLIELIIVMAIIGLFGGVIVSILFSLFRGSNKTSTLITLRQNGNYAIDQVTKVVRNAQSITNPSEDNCNGTPIVPETIDLSTLDSQQNIQTTTISCQNNLLTVTDPTGQKVLIDNSTVNVTCDISCKKDPGVRSPVIDFTVHVRQKDGISTNEKSGNLDFTTSINMRNAQ